MDNIVGPEIAWLGKYVQESAWRRDSFSLMISTSGIWDNENDLQLAASRLTLYIFFVVFYVHTLN